MIEPGLGQMCIQFRTIFDVERYGRLLAVKAKMHMRIRALNHQEYGAKQDDKQCDASIHEREEYRENLAISRTAVTVGWSET